MCDTESDCNDRGYCVEGQCLCDVAWFGDNCEENLRKTNPDAFVTYKIIFLIIYSVLGILSFYRLYSRVKKEKDLFARRRLIFMLKSLRSPYNLTMFAILVIAITRILWTSIDPFGYHERLNRSLERVLFETTYSFLFMIYIIVLWVWGAIYEELSLQRNGKKGLKRSMKWFRGKLKFFVILVIAVQMTTSILKGYHVDRIRAITLVLYVALFFVLVLVIIEYFVYGSLLHKCITDQEKTVKEQYDKLTIPALHAEVALAAYEKELFGIAKKINGEKSSPASDKNKRNLSATPRDTDYKSPKTDDLRYLNRLESEDAEILRNPQTMRPPTKADTKILDFEQVAQQDGFSLDHIEDVIQDQNSLPDQNSMPRTSHFVKSFSSPSNIKKHAQSSKNIKDNWFDLKVQEIVERHEAYLRPVDIVEDFGTEHIAANVSVIFDDNEDVIWDFEDINEVKIKEEQQKRRDVEIEQNKREITRMRNKTVVREASSLSITKDRIADFYRLKLLDDTTYLRNHQEITKNDKKIIRKIFSLTVIAICLEIIFVVITILIFGTPILQSTTGMVTSMWISGFIEISAIVAIIGLFSIVETTEKENLRLIMRIGQNKNRINKLYGFILPPYLRQEESKRKLEKRINQTTAPFFKGLDSFGN